MLIYKGSSMFHLVENNCLECTIAVIRAIPLFAIVRNERAATSTGIGPVTPAIETKRRVMVISGLYTETQYRRMGLGKQLVSHVTEMILRDGHVPMYWTEPEKPHRRRWLKDLATGRLGKRLPVVGVRSERAKSHMISTDFRSRIFDAF